MPAPFKVVAIVAPIALAAMTTPHAQQSEKILPTISVRSMQSVIEKEQLPAVSESIDAQQMAERVNLVNTEDGLKYLPGLIVRKRNFGDQQAPLATRTSGLGQSARSLIYADGVLLSAPIGNNNGSASPRWGLVAPEEIERIEVIYGPYSAAYPGNSMGAVVEIKTRMPQQFEGAAKAQLASQAYALYGTTDHYLSSQYSVVAGSRAGAWSWWLAGNHLDAHSQPVALITVARPATPSAAGTPVSGAIADTNRLGQAIAVIGAGGLESKLQDTLKAKLAYAITPQWQLAYTLGVFENHARSSVETYLRDALGNKVYAGASLNIDGYHYTNIGASAFSSTNGMYRIVQQHTAQSMTLKSDTRGSWDWTAIVSKLRFGVDQTRLPGTALPAAESGGAGSQVTLDGTGWSTVDVKGYWRPQGLGGAHQASFGVHSDRTKLVNTTYASADWINAASGAISANSLGKTRTDALWVQDAWRVASPMQLTLGGRLESWSAYDGVNFSTAPASNVRQPGMVATRFSPKLALAWDGDNDWRWSAAYGTAYRFPTVSELYQAITVSGVVFTPNPTLKPERAHSGELALEHSATPGRLRVSLFQENLSDALITQNATLTGTATVGASIQNIERIRARGLEVVADRRDVFTRGLDLSGSVTYVDSHILADAAFRNAVGVLIDVRGKRTPNIPRLKATVSANYRYDDRWSGMLAARYSERLWATLDNTDINANTYQGFDKFLVADLRINYAFDKKTRASLGVDNLNNRKYFLFHPFPQRTAMMELRHGF